MKQSIQKLENDNKKRTKIINDFVLLLQAIKKQYVILNKRKENLETRLKKVENYKTEQNRTLQNLLLIIEKQ